MSEVILLGQYTKILGFIVYYIWVYSSKYLYLIHNM
jgi:hypothetical protein